MITQYNDATLEEVNVSMVRSYAAFKEYRKLTLVQRAQFLKAIAIEMERNKRQLIETASVETHLSIDRLQVEFSRTLFQLTSYADACASGTWLDIRIDKGDPHRNPPKPDLRKMLVPLGPVVVFGASNFPFAYSTAGGDTACALAAGCPVVLKAHPAHAGTSKLVAASIQEAAKRQHISGDVFIHIHGSSFSVGQALVQHPLTKAVGFTGSFEGGKALFDLANQRPVPIPVFAEMGSVNPVFILPGKLKTELEGVVRMFAASITQSAGQFCTNPGLLIGIEDEHLALFSEKLGAAIAEVVPETMLHEGVSKKFYEKRQRALGEQGVRLLAASARPAGEKESIATLAMVPAATFIHNPLLHQEVFGPYSLLVICKDAGEMEQVAKALEGQLTATLLGSSEELEQHKELIGSIQDLCGRFIMNGVPTGVEVAVAMQHGGPFPATTDSRFTAVGADGIKRFARPICYQNWPDGLLPEELKEGNPLNLWRTVDNQLTKD